MATNHEIYTAGTIIDSWPADLDPETGERASNGGEEHLVEFGGRHYLVVTSWDGEVIHDPHGQGQEYEGEVSHG